MSKLKKAPLLEVVFELKWKVASQNNLQKYQYLHGDLYAFLKEEYKIREPLTPPELPVEMFIGKPVHRFRSEENGYPLFQTGPGIITLNTTDDAYEWDQYSSWCGKLLTAFFEAYPNSENEMFSPSLTYFDFFPLRVGEQNVLEFLERNLNLKITQPFLPNEEKPLSFSWGIVYTTVVGNMTVNLNTGLNGKKEEGLILQSGINGPEMNKKEDILNWLQSAHRSCHNLFHQMTEGPLYDSFN